MTITPTEAADTWADELADLLSGPVPPEPPAPEAPVHCDCCGRKRTVTNAGSNDFPEWLCGTCRHRRERRANCRMMWGRGRRGY